MAYNEKLLKDVEEQAAGGGRITQWVLYQAKRLAAEDGRAKDAPTIIYYRNAIGAMRAGMPGIWFFGEITARPFPPEVEKLRGQGPK